MLASICRVAYASVEKVTCRLLGYIVLQIFGGRSQRMTTSSTHNRFTLQSDIPSSSMYPTV